MVILETKHSVLNKLVKKLSLKELEEILFNLGYELENSEGDNLRIDVTTERPDLLSTYGLVRALRSYLGLKNEKYKIKKSDLVMNVIDPAKEWPYAVACIVKNLKFDDEKIKEIIRIQEKLGGTFLRNRRKGGLGLYPLNKINFPVIYTSENPKKIKYRPLEYNEEITGEEILEKHPTGRTYKHLVEGWKKFPIFKDYKNIIMSMPPIVNSHDVGKIDENTKEVFVEATGIDLKTITNAFNILVGALIDMGGDAYSINVKYENKNLIIPEFKEESRILIVEEVNSLLGMNFNSNEIKKLLEKMMYEVKSVTQDKLEILVPSNRSDIWHNVDIIDDVARAYGFNNFELRMNNVASIGSTTKSVEIKGALSNLLVGFGYQELFTLFVTSKQDQFDKMNIKEMKHIKLGKSVESGINMIRCWLLPELMKALNNNRSIEYPHKLFEISHVTVPDETKDVKSKDLLRLSLVNCHSNANFTEIKQILDFLMDSLEIKYEIKENEHGSFIPGRCCSIYFNKKGICFMGEGHPAVLKNWGLEMPACALELYLNDIFKLE